MDNQMKIVKNASETTAQAAEQTAENATSQVGDVYQQWLNSQKANMDKWTEMSQNFFKPFAGSNTNTEAFTNFGKNATEAYQTWMENWSKPFTSMMSGLTDGSSKDAYKNMLNTTNVYFKMFEFYAPFHKAITDKNFSPENLTKLFSPEKFKEVMDKSFDFVYPGPVKDLFEQASNWYEMLNNFNKHSANQYFSQFKDAGKMAPFFAFGGNDKLFDSYNNVFNIYQKSTSPLMRLIAPGKEGETAELYVNTLDKFAVYSTKLSELQYLVYVEGQKAIERTMTETYEKVSKGVEAGNFTDFFQHWVNNSENTFVEFFKTDDYSKLQAEILDIGVEIKSGFEKLMENALNPYPVVLRSEADDLHKTIYDLKKRVRDLEKQIGVTATAETGETSEDSEAKAGKTKKKSSGSTK